MCANTDPHGELPRFPYEGGLRHGVDLQNKDATERLLDDAGLEPSESQSAAVPTSGNELVERLSVDDDIDIDFDPIQMQVSAPDL